MKKVTKILSFVLSLCLMLSAFTFTAFAEYFLGTCGENLKWTIENGTLTISGKGEMYDVYVYDDYVSPWFQYKDFIKRLVIAEGVTYIGNGAFCNLNYIAEVNISSSVTSINEYAFYCLQNVVSINVSKNNPRYYSKNDCLIDSESKTLIFGCQTSAIPSDGSVTSIGTTAFIGALAEPTNVMIPETIKSIGERAFYDCSGIIEITLPKNLSTISKYTFGECLSLQKIEIPSTVTSIGEGAFYHCEHLQSVKLPDSVTSIGEEAFYHCIRLKEITIPKSVKSIGDRALGYYYDYDIWDYAKVENFTITGAKNSAAEKYATENGFKFIQMKTLSAENEYYLNEKTLTMPNVVEETTAETLVSALSNYGITVKITDKNGKNLSDTAEIGTGCKVTTTDGKAYTVIVKGDVDGTGEVDSTDYLQIKQVFIGTKSLYGVYFTAADVDNDNIITSTDYLKIKAHFLGNFGLYA